MAYRRGAYERTLASLERLVEKTREGGGGRLPNVVRLAERTGSSQRTVLKAVGALRERGLVDVSHGKGIVVRDGEADVCPEAPGQAARHAARLKHERVAAQIESDMMTGALAAQEQLPSAKVLSARYGVCNRTLKKALDRLTAAERVVPFGKGYRAVRSPAARCGGSVLVLHHVPEAGGASALHVGSIERLRALEHECVRQGLRPVSVAREAGFDELARTDGLARLSRGTQLLGCAILGARMVAGRLSDAVHRLSTLRLPVSIIDERGSAAFTFGPRLDRTVQVFTVTTTAQPGRHVAEHLIGLGHRRIAYISVHHEQPWSQRRLRGLRDAFARAGMDGGVSVYAFDKPPVNPHPTATIELRRSLDALLISRPDQPDDATADLLRQASRMRDTLNPMLDAQFGSGLRPLLERALQDDTVTAWVACNDVVGLQCLAFAARHRTIPRELSVVGFDDWVESLVANLTSYSFNASGLAHAAIDHLLHPKAPRTPRTGPTEVAGYVIERGTTAPPLLQP